MLDVIYLVWRPLRRASEQTRIKYVIYDIGPFFSKKKASICSWDHLPYQFYEIVDICHIIARIIVSAVYFDCLRAPPLCKAHKERCIQNVDACLFQVLKHVIEASNELNSKVLLWSLVTLVEINKNIGCASYSRTFSHPLLTPLSKFR